jgi:hypothetical protein
MESDKSIVVWMNKPDNIFIGVPQDLFNQEEAEMENALRPYTGHFLEALNLRRKRKRRRQKTVYYLEGENFLDIDPPKANILATREDVISNVLESNPNLPSIRKYGNNPELTNENSATKNNAGLVPMGKVTKTSNTKQEELRSQSGRHLNGSSKTNVLTDNDSEPVQNQQELLPELYFKPQIIDKLDVLWLCVLNNHGARAVPLIRYKL